MASQVSKSFVNNGGVSMVEEMIEAMVTMHPDHLVKLEGENVIIRADFETVKQTNVSLISGGGSGHEPAHAGYVGPGMLTAAVCGNVFASPSVNSIVKTIRTVTGPPGCLLIVKNYTGDRLNFGLAAEMAKTEGYKVELVIVADDSALESTGIAGRRGLAGTVFVHKIAGACASKGCALEEVVSAAKNTATNVRTVGCALSVCTIPGKPMSEKRLTDTDGLMELGLGIHGEPGRRTVELMETHEVVKEIGGMLLDDLKPKNDVAVILNNLGGTTPLEMYGIARSTLNFLKESNVVVRRIYVGPLMTSLEMQGFSMTLFDLTQNATTLEYLDLCTAAPGWPGIWFTYKGPETIPKNVPVVTVKSSALLACPDLSLDSASAELLGKRIRAGAQALIDHEPELTSWDKQVGDGDCGDAFKSGASLVLNNFDNFELTSPLQVLSKLGELAAQMGGTSGAILAIFFNACAAELPKSKDFGKALTEGCKAIMYYGGAKPGMRTMLDSLDALEKAWNNGENLTKISEIVMQVADSTATMKLAAGRSSYIPQEKLASIPDPGAKAIAFAIQGMISQE